jgi:hypothetical protein
MPNPVTRAFAISVLFVATLAVPQAQGPTPAFPAAGQPAIVTLVSPGAMPRAALRYSIAKDYKAHADMTMALSMTLAMAGMDGQSIPIPAMKLGADFTVTNVTAAGEVTYDFGFTGISSDSANPDPQTEALLQSFAADMKTMRGSATVSSRGESHGRSLDTSKVTNPQMSQMMGSLSTSLDSFVMPLPVEAVGVGAKWEGRQTVAANGIQVQQKSLWELVGVDGNDVKLKVTMEQTAAPQSITNPAMPAGADVALDKMTGSGSGTVTLHLNGLVPTSDVSTSSTMSMSINAGGQSQQVTVAVTAKMGIAPGKS